VTTRPSETSIWQSTARTPALGLPRLGGSERADVCVVGLGGSGLSAVLALVEAGVDVVGVDAHEVAAGAAGRNGGLLLAGLAGFHHDARRALGRERAAALYRETERERARLASATPDAVRETGSLRVATSPRERADIDRQFEAMREDGLAVERVETRYGDALRFPGDMACNPLERCRRLAADLAARGARLFERSPAVEIGADRVATSDGEVRAGRVVVAVDGGLDRLLPEVASRVRTVRLQMLGTAPAADVTIDAPMYLRFGHEYVQQLPDGRLALGGFRDRFDDEEQTHDTRPTPGVQAEIEHFLRGTLRTEAPVTERWAATVGYVDGPLPHFGEVRGGVIAVGGYSGTGNLVGALAGRAAADLALGRGSAAVELLGAP